MALDLPTLVQKVRIDSDTAAGEKAATGSLQRIGGTATKVGIGMTAGLTVPILAMAKTGVDAASDLAESNSKVGVVFEDNAEKVRAFASTAAESLGMSEQKALEATGTFGNLFRALGTGSDDAARMSTELVTLAADLASFNNANPEDVLLALRSGLLGEAEPLRQFGVSLSAARIEAEALASGLVKPTQNLTKVTEATLKVEEANWKLQKAMKENGEGSYEVEKARLAVTKAEEAMAAATEGSVEELTAAQKAQAAYQVIMKDTALAQGDFERTSDGLANRQRIVAAQFEDTKAALGESLLPAVETGVGLVQKLLAAFSGLSPEIQATVSKVALAVAAIGPLLIVGGKLASSFTAIKAVIGGASVLGLAPALPVIAAVAGAGFLIVKNWDKIAPLLTTVKDAAGQLFGVLFSGDFKGGPLAEDSPIVDKAFQIRDAVIDLLGVGRQLFDVLFKGDFKGGPLSEDSPIIDGAFKVRDAAFKVADVFKTDVLPILERVGSFIKDNARPILIGLGAAFALVTAPVTTVVAALVLAYTRFSAFRNVVQGVVSFILGTVVPAVVNFASAVGTQVGNLIGFFQKIAPDVQEALGHVLAVIETVLGVVRTVIETVLGVVAALWRAWGDDLFSIVGAVFTAIQEVVNSVLDVIRGIIVTVLAVINGDWGKAWDGILTILRGVWDTIFGVIRGAASTVASILGGIVSTFGEVFRPVGNFLHTWVISPIESMVGFIAGLPSRIKSAASGAFDGLKEAFKGAVNFIIRGWNSLEFKIPGFDPPGPGPKFGGMTIGVPKIKELALGGRSIPGQPFFAGERGTELVDPGFKGSAQVLNANRSERLLRQIAGGLGDRGEERTVFAPRIETVDRRSGEQLGRDLAWGWTSARGVPMDYEGAGV